MASQDFHGVGRVYLCSALLFVLLALPLASSAGSLPLVILLAQSGGASVGDSDADGVDDPQDNCVDDANGSQLDSLLVTQ